MKKTLKSLAAILSCAICTAPLTLAHAHAYMRYQYDYEMPEYYDLNNDGLHNVADVVISAKLLEEGSFTSTDVSNVCNLMIGKDIEIDFQEMDIEGYDATSEEDIAEIERITSGHCVDYKLEEPFCVRYRFLYDGMITELRCSSDDFIDTAVAVLTYDGVQNVIGISADNEFVIDNATSFDLPHEFHPYECWDLDDRSPSSAKALLTGSGKFQYFEVNPTSDGCSVRFFFDNALTVTELNLERVAEIEQEIRTFCYDGEYITVGITADGQVALDTYSFDIAE